MSNKETNLLNYIKKLPDSKEKEFVFELVNGLNPEKMKTLNAAAQEVYIDGYVAGKQDGAKQAETAKVSSASQSTTSSSVAAASQTASQAGSGVEAKKPENSQNIRDSIQKIIFKIQNETVKLPVFPHVAKKVLDLIDSQKATIAGIAREIKYDPMITSKILEIANSAYYGGSKEILSIEQAIVKIGLVEVTKHLYRFATKDIFKFDNPAIEDLGATISDHMTASSYAAQLYAIRNKLAYPEKYLLLTMFHDIGKMWILQILNDFMRIEKEKFDITPEGILMIFNQLHIPFGMSLLMKWNFDQAYIEIVKKHHTKFKEDSKQLLIVKFGNLLAKLCGYTEQEKTIDIVDEEMDVLDYLKVKESQLEKFKEQIMEFMSFQSKHD